MNRSQVIAMHGTDSVYGVIEHAKLQAKRGKRPSLVFNGIKNPLKALAAARHMLEHGVMPPSTDAAPGTRYKMRKIRISRADQIVPDVAPLKAETLEASLPLVTIVLGNTVSMEAAEAWAEGEFPGRVRGYLRKKSPRKHVEESGDPNLKYFDPTKKNGKTASSKDGQAGLPKQKPPIEHEAHALGIA